jgi:hypothetical protein
MLSALILFALSADPRPPSLVVHDELRIEGPLSQADVSGIVFDKHYKLVDCYMRNVHRGSSAATVYVQLRIDPKGEVINSGLMNKWTEEEKAAWCILAEVKKWKFPRAPASSTLTLRLSADPGDHPGATGAQR